ncbi:prostaglandin D2 receptor-like [Polyodon spathula]|uniref:prostaglandin D2 receptor-like n=1 Tax=Polyodon spathula TaxID=7913 RepID=UPI001B7DE7BA|nr:prostaglandin D2 receptor-like [Polyodon spathula]
MNVSSSSVPSPNLTSIDENNSVVPSAVLFALGVTGNVIALCILYLHKHNSNRVSVFYVLVTGLVWTDLLGKLVISPMVLVCYSTRQPVGEGMQCNAFGALMVFFGLCSMFILLAMAVECWLSIGHPYFYQRHVNRRKALLMFPFIYLFCLLFCALPLILGSEFGRYKSYFPRTWCYIDMNRPHHVYSVLFGTLTGLLILLIVAFNLSVMISLLKMYKLSRKQKIRRGSFERAENQGAHNGHAEELDHLVLLALMTFIFIICSVPVTVRTYIGAFSQASEDNEAKDLMALRFLSVNSIVDPWVFIIFRTSLFRMMVHKLYDKLCHTTLNG